MAHKKNIALVYVSSTLSSSPLSLGDITAYALADEDIRKEADINIFHLPRDPSYEKEIKSILQTNPALIGFSAYSWNFYHLKKIAQMIKEARNDIPILFGGPNVSGNKRIKECFKDYPFIDFIIEGEGEIAFRELLKTMLHAPDNLDKYKQVPSLSFRYDGELIINPTAERISNLDEIPSPYLMNILKPNPLGPVIWETNRGCPYRCAYCYWGNGKSKLYKYSIERLEEELKWFAHNDVHFFWNADSNFGLMRRDREIAEMFCRINDEHGQPFKNFGVNWAKNSGEKIVDIAEIFIKNNVETSLTIAYQTLTPEAAELSKRKSLSLDSGSQILQMATAKNIPVYTDLIWGLPGESYNDFLKSIDKIVDIGIQSIYIHPLEVIPGTKYYEDKAKFGLEVLDPINHSHALVLSHRKMSIDDQREGVMTICAHHLFHTFKICHIVNRYLNLSYGIKHSQICKFFIAYSKKNNLVYISDEVDIMRQKIFSSLPIAAERHGAMLDDIINKIAYAFWDHWKVAEDMFLDFYKELLSSYYNDISTDQLQEIQELLRFNLLIAPKPGWAPRDVYTFSYDVGRFYHEIMQHWIAAAPASDMPKLEKRDCEYQFTNSWLSRPVVGNSDWTRAIPARICRFKKI